MRILTPWFVKRFEGRLINLHPALLPQFPGTHAIERAFAAGVRETGCTVHYVDAGVDTGEIIAQEKVPVNPEDTLESLAERIHEAEHRLLPQVVANLLKTIPERES
ncbi:MAG: phosphoribosylglycinamide formyltransferase, partial [Candidatus Hydrogenedentota bacterium]